MAPKKPFSDQPTKESYEKNKCNHNGSHFGDGFY